VWCWRHVFFVLVRGGVFPEQLALLSMDDTPPLFKQGAPARVRAGFFVILALVMLMVDARMHLLEKVRVGIGITLYPLQTLALMPRDIAYAASDYFHSLSTLQHENSGLRAQSILNGQVLQREQQIAAENIQLRKLLGMQENLPIRSVAGEVLYDARDPFTRKIILNRGSHHDVTPGQPVIDDVGVVGQITRVFPLWSEVTLLTDQDQAIPVQVLRNGLRSVAYGSGQSGELDLRFMATNADIQKDDVLVTSGIDSVYPPGLVVATVTQVETKSAAAFARIICKPIAGIDRNKIFLILLTEKPQGPKLELENDMKKGDNSLQQRLRNRREGEKKETEDEASATHMVPVLGLGPDLHGGERA
jgi:rod shape-determining protein MreC